MDHGTRSVVVPGRHGSVKAKESHFDGPKRNLNRFVINR